MAGGIGYGSTQVSSAFPTQHVGGNSSTVSNVALVPGLTPNQVNFVIIEINKLFTKLFYFMNISKITKKIRYLIPLHCY
jgi:hypothetical protein